jgi:hypothetical protein
MAQHKVKLSQVIRDFIITLDDDDYASNASDSAIRNFALRGVRDMGFDFGNKIKSLKLKIQANNTVPLPVDFAGLVKIGIVDDNGYVRVFGENKSINYSREYVNNAVPNTYNQYNIKDYSPTDITDAAPFESDSQYYDGYHKIINNLNANTTSAKGDTQDPIGDFPYVFHNYTYQGGVGNLYGIGGGHMSGEYRLNLDENRIEIETASGRSEVVIEYVADEARSVDPEIHVYAEEALRCYIYYKIIERKASVPANEKARARQEYYNERRKASARFASFSKDEALQVIRKNYQLAPKY